MSTSTATTSITADPGAVAIAPIAATLSRQSTLSPDNAGRTAQLLAWSALNAAGHRPLAEQVPLLLEFARREAASCAEEELRPIEAERARQAPRQIAAFSEKMQRVLGIPGLVPDNDALDEATLPGTEIRVWLRAGSGTEDVVFVDRCRECGEFTFSEPMRRGLRDVGEWMEGRHRRPHVHPLPASERLRDVLSTIGEKSAAYYGRRDYFRSSHETFGQLYDAVQNYRAAEPGLKAEALSVLAAMIVGALASPAEPDSTPADARQPAATGVDKKKR